MEQSQSDARKEGPRDLPRWTIFNPAFEEYGSDAELRREYAERQVAVEEAIAYVERRLHTSSD